MKKVIKFFLILVLIGVLVSLFYKEDIYKFVVREYLYNKEIKIENNNYSKNESYNYVKLTNDFIANDKEEIKNIIYTIINSGTSSFEFYCDSYYENCINDFKDLVKKDVSNINNFVHPYNSFKEINFIIDKNKITINPIKKYSSDDIIKLNQKVDEILNKLAISNMTNYEKIKTIHDYIINNSYYLLNDETKDGKANDILLKGYGICSSYTDTMAIILDRFNLNNYKVASTDHIWNLVYLNNNWLHLDLTYDDPVVVGGGSMLLKDMLLINTNSLYLINDKNHKFDISIYSEAK